MLLLIVVKVITIALFENNTGFGIAKYSVHVYSDEHSVTTPSHHVFN